MGGAYHIGLLDRHEAVGQSPNRLGSVQGREVLGSLPGADKGVLRLE